MLFSMQQRIVIRRPRRSDMEDACTDEMLVDNDDIDEDVDIEC